MSNGKRRKESTSPVLKTKSPLILVALICLWSLLLGWGGALAMKPSTELGFASKSVDPVPSRYQLGRDLYLENCSRCHIPIPPAVFPSETWRQLLEQPNEHYGTQLKPLIGPSLLVLWDYLRTFSRPLNDEEATPYRFEESRYFKALHPLVEFPESVNRQSCVTCHPQASQFNYRSLTPEWRD